MKYILISSTILAMVLTGCNDTDICCQEKDKQVLTEKGTIHQPTEKTVISEPSEKPIIDEMAPPIAVITRTEAEGYTFDCNESFDQDENGNSIEKCEWDTKGYNSNDEIIKENKGTLDEKSVTINPCGNALYAVIILTVTDDENETNTTSIRVNF